MATANTIQIVPDEERELADAEAQGGMIADKIKKVADVTTVPLAAYAATRPELPTIARVGFGVVAVAKGAPWLRRAKNWFAKYY